MHDVLSPAATGSQLSVASPARPTRFCESRKLSVPVRVHSITKEIWFISARCQVAAPNPFLTHVTVESSAKRFLKQFTAFK
jgi:hypothetical protein